MAITIIPLLKSAEWTRLAVGKNLLVSSLPVENAAASIAASLIFYGLDQADNVAFLPATGSNLQRIATISHSPRCVSDLLILVSRGF
jgi:hypothetical protein